MISRRNRELAPENTEQTPCAIKAKDLGALRDAVVDAAGVNAERRATSQPATAARISATVDSR
jgi:hypothetical protein